ncbi:2,4-dienoyl-CoA reductase-like NADH-dependent reductase (Old Yellow Enzyme family) [Litorivivens lipolytica]|uniref:2,4-dienoyl-CoA reductase-like NADH-dependent reductase (Old Yellow Enzyme family) n=1 Tax=Litorivivens lipolytica TaxID=1524264 RepID=A0A7W4W621_9GAMM|nr:NADH:flavin oxidoreductase [Litorivivens lipolytica]MBB3047534.1 2,4-dienoyl-CoA reductase-like NADH-dependent reductase (Old Yellow Enzyme family) [Litorivivens lipolytica]
MSQATLDNVPNPFSPLTLGPITLRNRFLKSGANENMYRKGFPTKALLKHHRDLAAGGIALTTMAYAAVAKVGRTLPDQLWLRPEVLPDLKAITDAVHAEGGKISLQLTHGGSFVTSIFLPHRTISASGGLNVAGLFHGNILQRPMNENDMSLVIQQFADGARMAREAGFDAVEIHMGHGYLLNQFISPLSNRRTDEYGGSAENRVRFPARVLSAVKEAVGVDMAVLAKINVADGVRRGATAEDAVVTAKALEAAGADMLVLSGGRNVESTWFMFGSPMNQAEFAKVFKHQPLQRLLMKAAAAGTPKDLKFREMYFEEYSRKVRAAVKLPLTYLGGVKSLDNVEKAMAEGFDAVAMARILLHDPALVNKFQEGTVRQSGCTSCNACIPQIYNQAGTYCVLNEPLDPAMNEIRASQ